MHGASQPPATVLAGHDVRWADPRQRAEMNPHLLAVARRPA